jgi:hypothetical protein
MDTMKNLNNWDLANAKKDYIRFATIFSSRAVQYGLATRQGMERAMNWCRELGITKVYIESFRHGVEAPAEILIKARDAFREAGFEVSGGVTTNGVGKPSSGWNMSCCYTDPRAGEALAGVFERAVRIFDQLIIDDFFFTDCECEECVRAKGDREWWQYRTELMERVGREKVLEPARAANPDAKIILKYPQWYDRLHQRGYDTIRHTENFPIIYVGTETRDRDHKESLPHTVQYMGFNIERWFQSIGGDKLLGGWFDNYGTGPAMFVDQAIQTILGGVREAMLFNYGSLNKSNGIEDAAEFGRHVPALLALAEAIHGKKARGIPAHKPANADYGKERDVYDVTGVLGLPVLPTIHLEPATAPAAFLPVHAASDPQIGAIIEALLKRKKPVLVTDGFAEKMGDALPRSPLVKVLNVKGDAFSLLKTDDAELRALRAHLLPSLGLEMEAPIDVALYLYDDDLIVLNNFRDEAATIRLRGAGIEKAELVARVPANAEINLCGGTGGFEARLAPRAVAVIRVR